MKKIMRFRYLFLAALFITSCKKDNTMPTGPNANSGNFFANTEWTGLTVTYGQSYQKPCYLHFNGDTTVTIYALFNWVIGATVEGIDSVVGKITSIDVSNSALVTINVNFPFTNDQQTYTITDKKSLKGGSTSTSMSTPYTVFSMQLDICPTAIEDISVTPWGTDKITEVGPTQGMYEFPDINGVSFNADGTTSYTRGGRPVSYSPPDQQQALLQKYTQIGYRVYFGGFNESIDRLLGYFGVITADGSKILADTRASGSRIPYSYETIYWYGPPGVTPNMHKD